MLLVFCSFVFLFAVTCSPFSVTAFVYEVPCVQCVGLCSSLSQMLWYFQDGVTVCQVVRSEGLFPSACESGNLPINTSPAHKVLLTFSYI